MVALFVILFVVVLLTIDLVIQARQKKYPLMSRVPSAVMSVASSLVRIPKGVFFHPGHTWARMQGGDEVAVGIDDFAQKTIGRIERVTLPFIGQKVTQGDPIITVQHGGRTLSMVAPVSGRVISVNRDVQDNPALITENPYNEGWLFMIEPEQLATNLTVLSIAENAAKWIREEATRLRDFLATQGQQPALVGETMLDGGVPVGGSLDLLDENGVKQFEEEFLR
jgi:glycine cleavage system H lipoate-binding protein